MKIFITVFMMAAFAQMSAAQEKLKTVTLTDTIVFSAVDRPGDFYLGTKEGQIQKIDRDGNLIVLYKGNYPPTVFDPRDGSRLFAYYRHDQHYEFLSPSLETTASYKIDSAFAIQPWLMCPSGDHKLWLLDKADHSLKKINVRESEVELEVVVDSALIGKSEGFKTMREYQNFVFLLHPDKGILIFNNLGTHLRTIDVAGIRNFNFLGEELYYLRGKSLEFFNLFTAETRRITVGPGALEALVTDERLLLVTPRQIDIFSFRP